MSTPVGDGGLTNAGSAFVLDDEPQIGALVCQVLGRFGAAPRQFTTPAPFLEELRQSPPELVVLDLSLGQSDAVEVIRHLEDARYQGRVLLISGRDQATLDEITQIGEKHGLAMLPPLKKPFRASDLKKRLSGYVAAQPKTRDARAQDGAGETAQQASVQLAEALRNDWLELWYQPKFDLASFTVCGAEGLIRARHPTHGIITPDRLLPPAGDPAYHALTRFVIERAVADWRRFAQQGLALKLSINAPVSVIHTPAFITLVRSTLPREPAFSGLTVEVTEDELIRDSDGAHEVASQLKLYNVDLSIDDFGSGYASLSRLKDLPFVEVKIDRSIVSACASNPLKHSLCQTVVDLAHRFGAKACGEGVETTDDLRALIAMGCDSAQGFLFAKPIPADQFTPTLVAGIAAAIRALLREPGKDLGLAQSA
jgi:EAL domain-containing protein (putative c-di-GMP-specific phosphodiesterase class I)/ActR/RegA family two-component response regulator